MTESLKELKIMNWTHINKQSVGTDIPSNRSLDLTHEQSSEALNINSDTIFKNI